MLGNKGQGALALYTNFIILSSLIISIGLPPGIVHFIASGKVAKEKLFSLLLGILAVGLGLLFVVIQFLSSFSLLDTFLPEFFHLSTFWLIFLFIHLFFTVLNSFLASTLQAENKFKQAGYIVIQGSITFLALYALKYYFQILDNVEPLKWILGSLLCGNIFQFIFYIVEVYKTNTTYFHFGKIETDVIKPLMQFAFLAFATNLIQFLSYKMDIWFVNYFHGKEQTGIYSLGVSLAQMVWILPAAIQAVLYAFISTHQDKKQQIEKTITTTKQIGIYALAAGVSGYLTALYLVPILFGEAFRESVHVIGILLLGVVPFCLSMAVSGYFAATGRVKINLHSAILGFIVCLLADILLIPDYGIIGASVASVISYLSTVLYLLILFYRETTKRQ